MATEQTNAQVRAEFRRLFEVLHESLRSAERLQGLEIPSPREELVVTDFNRAKSALAAVHNALSQRLQRYEGMVKSKITPVELVYEAPPVNTFETLLRIVALAVEVLGTREKALQWLNTPVPDLDGEKPFSLLDTPEGIQRVEDALGQMAHGVW